jgi:hypothetical protein
LHEWGAANREAVIAENRGHATDVRGAEAGGSLGRPLSPGQELLQQFKFLADG